MRTFLTTIVMLVLVVILSVTAYALYHRRQQVGVVHTMNVTDNHLVIHGGQIDEVGKAASPTMLYEIHSCPYLKHDPHYDEVIVVYSDGTSKMLGFVDEPEIDKLPTYLWHEEIEIDCGKDL